MNDQERAQKIEEYAQGQNMIDAALVAVPQEAAGFWPAPAEWNVNEIIFHMADSELIGVTRLNMIVAQPGSTLMSYDDNKWGEALNRTGRSVEAALQLFRLLRQETHQLLRSLPETAFANSVIHPDNPYPEFGADYNIDKWLRIYTWHVSNHIEQMQKNVAAWEAAGKPSV